MRSLRALFLLVTACLAVSASPVLTPPDDIQVQENFDISRVRLASQAAMAGCLSRWASQGSQSPKPKLGGWVPKGPSCSDRPGFAETTTLCTCHSVGPLV